ncbi:MAG: hypothetical protein K2H45_07185 [Acetatifactor sp.]|nr:hypothetical protein [Acetatifactor sp.]
MGRMDGYFEIIDLSMIAKIEEHIPYIYDSQQGWIVDKEFILLDRIMGYDASEPKGSPYKFGNLDMLERVRKISREEAEKRISKKF